MVNYDVSSGVSVSVSPVSNKELKSVLSIRGVTHLHSGQYSCSPSQVSPDSVTVRVKHKEVDDPEPVVNRAAETVAFVGISLLLICKNT